MLPQQWDQVSDFVRTHTAAMCAGHDFDHTTVRAYLTSLTQLAVWGIDTFGELDIEHLLTNNNIHYFCTRVLDSGDDRFRATKRATLNRMGRSLNPKFGARGTTGLGFKRPLEALTPAEEGRIPDWINTQSTCERKRNCGVAVALTLGAGLRTSELGRLRLHDLDVTEDGIVVKPYGHNGAGPRETVVRTAGRTPYLLHWTGWNLMTTCTDQTATRSTRSRSPTTSSGAPPTRYLPLICADYVTPGYAT
ncbi:hypothetical protein ACQX2P_00190 [Corynebacterium diphtheriae]